MGKQGKAAIKKAATSLVTCCEKRRENIKKSQQTLLDVIGYVERGKDTKRAQAKKRIAEYAAAVASHAGAENTPPDEAVKEIGQANDALVQICEQLLGHLNSAVRAQQKADVDYAALSAKVTKFMEETLSHNKSVNEAIAEAVINNGEGGGGVGASAPGAGSHRGLAFNWQRYSKAPFRCQALVAKKLNR